MSDGHPNAVPLDGGVENGQRLMDGDGCVVKSRTPHHELHLR